MNPSFAHQVDSEFLRQLWEKSYDPFWICTCLGNDFEIIEVNPAEKEIDPRLRPGTSLRSFIGHGDEADDLISGYFECVETGEPIRFRQCPVIDGNERLFETLLIPIADTTGKVTHICGTARELTPFLEAQRSLEDVNRQLEIRVAERTRELNRVNEELREANLILEKLAAADGLTDLANRRHFFERATAEVLRTQRYGHPLSLQILDIDHFKEINDQFGHAAGDEVLKYFADILRASLRSNDLAARIGGEEFVILLPESGIDDALALAERIRHTIESTVIRFDDHHLTITVSIGVATLLAGEISPDAMLRRADSALYQAKQAGRNRVLSSTFNETDKDLELP